MTGFLRFLSTHRTAGGHTGESNVGTRIAGQTAFAGVVVNGLPGPIRLRFTDNAQGYPNSITAIDWVFNSNGATLNAGEAAPTSTPEPGSLSLLALAAGATGILALHRKNAA